jgi:hypothetical protein
MFEIQTYIKTTVLAQAVKKQPLSLSGLLFQGVLLPALIYRLEPLTYSVLLLLSSPPTVLHDGIYARG